MFRGSIIIRLLHCVNETIQVTNDRTYFPRRLYTARGPHVDQPWHKFSVPHVYPNHYNHLTNYLLLNTDSINLPDIIAYWASVNIFVTVKWPRAFVKTPGASSRCLWLPNSTVMSQVAHYLAPWNRQRNANFCPVSVISNSTTYCLNKTACHFHCLWQYINLQPWSKWCYWYLNFIRKHICHCVIRDCRIWGLGGLKCYNAYKSRAYRCSDASTRTPTHSHTRWREFSYGMMTPQARFSTLHEWKQVDMSLRTLQKATIYRVFHDFRA